MGETRLNDRPDLLEHPGGHSQKVHGGGGGGGVGGRLSTTGDKGESTAAKSHAQNAQGRANAARYPKGSLHPSYALGVKAMKAGDRSHKIGDYADAASQYRAAESHFGDAS